MRVSNETLKQIKELNVPLPYNELSAKNIVEFLRLNYNIHICHKQTSLGDTEFTITNSRGKILCVPETYMYYGAYPNHKYTDTYNVNGGIEPTIIKALKLINHGKNNT